MLEQLQKQLNYLKSEYVEAKVTSIMGTIPEGHCPAAYFNFDDIEVDCNEVSCFQCKQLFQVRIEQEVREEMEKELAEL